MFKKVGVFVICVLTFLFSCGTKFSVSELNGNYYGPCSTYLSVGGQNISSNPALTSITIEGNNTATFYFDTDIPYLPQNLTNVPMDIDYLSRSVRFNTSVGIDTFYGSVNTDHHLVWRYERSDTIFHFSAQKN